VVGADGDVLDASREVVRKTALSSAAVGARTTRGDAALSNARPLASPFTVTI
jgi:hypothetical protein